MQAIAYRARSNVFNRMKWQKKICHIAKAFKWEYFRSTCSSSSSSMVNRSASTTLANVGIYNRTTFHNDVRLFHLYINNVIIHFSRKRHTHGTKAVMLMSSSNPNARRSITYDNGSLHIHATGRAWSLWLNIIFDDFNNSIDSNRFSIRYENTFDTLNGNFP